MTEQESHITNIYYNVHIEGDAVGIVIGSGTINAQNIAGGDIVQQTIPVSPKFVYANVPTMPNHFVGRDAQVVQLVQQLTSGQTLALSADGLPGVGKTTLAVAIAHHGKILQHFSDGILWGGLGTNADPMRILGEWATALGYDLSHLPTPEERQRALHNILGNKKILLVLDDAWQLEPATLLRCGGPHCAHLLTTRNKSIARAFAGTSQMNNVDTLALADGVALLQQLAPEACASNPEAAAQLVQAVGGLPLAIELLGGYLADPNAPERLYFAEEMAQAFDDLTIPAQRLQLASQRLGSHDAPTSLQATIELSLADLPAATQTAFYCLGAFAPKPATFSWEAARAVTEANNRQLATLLERNLLEQDGDWLSLHQTLADVAASHEEVAAATERHRNFYLQLANQDCNDWQTIEQAYEQIKQAWLISENENLIEYYWSLFEYQDNRGLKEEQIQWTQKALNFVQQSNDHFVTGSILRNLGKLYFDLGNLPLALSTFTKAIQQFEGNDDHDYQIMLGESFIDKGFVYNQWHDYEHSRQCFNQAYISFKKIKANNYQAKALYLLGMILAQQNQIADAIQSCLEAVEVANDPLEKARSYTMLGDIFWQVNDLPQALDFHFKALGIFEKFEDERGRAREYIGIAGIYRDKNQYEKTLYYLQNALKLHQKRGDVPAQSSVLNNIGSIFLTKGDEEQALQYYLNSLDLCKNIYALQERLTRFNLYSIYNSRKELDKAFNELNQVVELDKLIDHPDLEKHQALLVQLKAQLTTRDS